MCSAFCLLQHHLQSGALEGGFSLLLQHLPQISCSNAALAQAGMKLWLSLLVAAAAAGQHDVQAQVEEVMRQAAHEAMSLLDWAWVSIVSALQLPDDGMPSLQHQEVLLWLRTALRCASLPQKRVCMSSPHQLTDTD